MELTELKELANKLGVTYHHMAGAEKIKTAIIEHCNTVLQKPFEEVAKEYGYMVETTPPTNTPSAYTPTPTNEQQSEQIKRLSKLTFDDIDVKAKKKANDNAYKDAMKLVRCIISCNNKNKTSYTGEIFSVRNAAIEEVKKFIPFGTPTHIPVILLNMIREKQYQMFRKEKLPNGNSITRSYLVPEYNIQELPPLTTEEFNAIKRKQLAEGGDNTNV